MTLFRTKTPDSTVWKRFRSITEAGVYGASIPAREARTWTRTLARLNRLGDTPPR